MWVLIVMQLVAGSATAKNSFPIVYSGVEMQEFASQETCNAAKASIQKMMEKRNDGGYAFTINNGVLGLECVKK